MNFGESLSSIMLEKGITSLKMASDIGVSVVAVNRWKKRTVDIGLNYLIRICRYLECSLEYLIGRTDTNIAPIGYEIKNFGEQLRIVLKSKGVSTYKLQKETRYSGGYLYDWDKGSYPQLSTLLELSDYLNCTLDELVGLD